MFSQPAYSIHVRCSWQTIMLISVWVFCSKSLQPSLEDLKVFSVIFELILGLNVTPKVLIRKLLMSCKGSKFGGSFSPVREWFTLNGVHGQQGGCSAWSNWSNWLYSVLLVSVSLSTLTMNLAVIFFYIFWSHQFIFYDVCKNLLWF